jgi:UDP-N-acetylglucosamine--N-acetylmuramyl-(pentapeptide) pyrophosphoryl-undecaprenol N-acetylglucosamine transferase
MRVLISGGGTGGHIFPAVSIANALRAQDPNCEILFVGALGRMEMERVPQAGYEIVGLPVRGIDRSRPWRNIRVAIDFVRSMWQVRQIIHRFRPDVGVGVGGYASGAAMKVAAKMGVPILLQEQNGFAGVTNKMLKNDASKICVAYEGMERFFPAEKLILTGNPVRQNLSTGTKESAIRYFNETFGVQFSTERKTLLIIGGSLGARTINNSIIAHLPELINSDVQVIWQTGKYYFEDCKKALSSQLSNNRSSECEIRTLNSQLIICTDFIGQMPDAYALADLVISRAGASSISELCLLGKPSILVPSPNVAEDHQTHNAMALVRKNAAVLVKDIDAQEQMVATALQLIEDDSTLLSLHTNILTLALPDSANLIANEVIQLATHS